MGPLGLPPDHDGTAAMRLPDEVDVLVLGFGPAGASAAVAAADAGARVAVVEKSESGGGNCPNSGGFLFDVDGPSAVEHLDALCFGKTDREVLAAFVEGLHEVAPWLHSLGGQTEPVVLEQFKGVLPSWPHFPGAGHVTYRQYAAARGKRPGPALWELLEQGVASRDVSVATGAPAASLVIEDGTVCGARLDRRDPGRCEIRAAGGVVLACGSFEADPLLRDTYLPVPLVSVGHQGNTGDSLRLTQQAGGAAWHMSAFFGWFAFSHPEFAAAFPLDIHAPSFIYVDADGRRFANETGWEVHDKVRSISHYLPRRHNYPHLPGYVVFDEAARLAGPLNGIVGTPNDYTWSADNSAEVEQGWIKHGDTPGELARAAGIDPATLGATLDAYAVAVDAGRDEDFGRSPETLVALEPPLFAIEMRPGVATASGGPRRDAHARVLRPDGTAISGLYGAGAAGSIWGHLTEHGGGLTDAIVFGRIAGEHAAAGARRPTTTAASKGAT